MTAASVFKGFSSLLQRGIVPSHRKVICRSTFILKRRHIPPLMPVGSKEKVELKEDHYVYDLVEDTNTRKQGTIDVILTEFVEDVGKRGQQVTVKEIFGYNFLILPGRAVYVTPENMAKYKEEEIKEEADEHSSMSAYKTQKMLQTMVLSLFVNMYQSWTIEPWHIRTAFRKEGVFITDDSCITMPPKPISGPDYDIEGKDFAVIITINNTEQVPVRCRIRHWASQLSDKLPLDPDHNITAAEPILQEQAELLASMPLPKPTPKQADTTTTAKEKRKAGKKLRLTRKK